MKETLFVSTSGGRTSGFMSIWCEENLSDQFNLIHVFANTGLEDPKTLEFVDRCDREYNLNTVWVEAVVNPEKNKGTTHKIVDFETASRNGEPMEAVFSKYGLSNHDWPHCTREAKIAPIESYMRSLGFKRGHQRAIGIRVDEIDRMSFTRMEKGEVIYPLIKINPTNKAQIRHWWAAQNFDLEVPEHRGNCVGCWKKSDRKLYTACQETPGVFEWLSEMEGKYENVSPMEGETRRMFRRYRTAKDIIASSNQPFIPFVDHMPELQLTLDIDPMDIEDDCSAGCEI